MRPDVFAAVMATGIVSIAAADHGFSVISEVLIVIAAVMLLVLMVMVARAWREFDMRDPNVTLPLFTYIAACAVVGARLADHRIVLWVLAGMALQGWLSLMPLAVRSMWRHRWTGLRDRARGGWELAAVATSGLAIVSAKLDVLFWAVVFWMLGICMYLVMTALVLWRVRHDASSPELVQPDVWILMGGIAIATLAGDHLHHIMIAGPIADGVRAVTIWTWVVATVWIPVLVYVAFRRSVGLGWPAVFPLGMYSSATYAMAVETGWRSFVTISLTFFWIAFAA
ncbi:MAG: tellurite resistance/C4-dicarboxylate transporter family protein, partial [Mycobacterium sp.]